MHHEQGAGKSRTYGIQRGGGDAGVGTNRPWGHWRRGWNGRHSGRGYRCSTKRCAKPGHNARSDWTDDHDSGFDPDARNGATWHVKPSSGNGNTQSGYGTSNSRYCRANARNSYSAEQSGKSKSRNEST